MHEIEDLSAEQLNEIPAGFNNNIIWNLGHMVAAQQGICYIRAGLPIVVEEKYFAEYKPGTRPEKFIDMVEIQRIKDLMLSTLNQLLTDSDTTIFDSYKPWITRYGNIELGNVNEATTFLLFHEGLHSGVILALKKLVSK